MKSYISISFSCYVAVALFLAPSCTKNVTQKHDTNDTTHVTPPPAGINATVTTIAGRLNEHGNAEDGNGANARFWNPTKMVYDYRNNMLYVADGTTIRSIDQQNNVKTYLPPGAVSTYNEILDLDLAPGAGGTLYATSAENDLLKIEPNGSSSKLTRLADRVYGGNATGPLNTADHFDGAHGIATGKNGEIYFFNAFWNTMHRITLTSATTGMVTPFVGKPAPDRSGTAWPYQDGQGEAATFSGSIPDIASDGNGNIYVADYRNDLVRMVTPDGVVSSFCRYVHGGGIDQDGPVATAQANRPNMVSATRDGSLVFFATLGSGSNATPALRVVRQGKEVVTVVESKLQYGDGTGKTAGFGTVGGLAVTPDGKTVYVSEPGKKVIRKVSIQ